MQRIAVILDDDLMDEFDTMIVEQGYQNRSEAIRDFTRAGMQQAAQKMGKSAACMGISSSMSTTTPRAISQNAWCRNSMVTTTSRWQPCTSISTTTIAWR